ncbi:hypothetical protein BC936DRAFT_141700 [Jimgerdemannia flammicorona]|uniref:Uncharacterized protein n=1 Tax=Jimgerdemannia flammicorona TaxID=994334 RepID=A0A433A1R7_9FUNG|nr:hypothetical protein BC936DRAFT_141700 [Jimgerdemannia flammicorona]
MTRQAIKPSVLCHLVQTSLQDVSRKWQKIRRVSVPFYRFCANPTRPDIRQFSPPNRDIREHGFISKRSKIHIVLSGSETEEEARAAEFLPVILPFPAKTMSFHEERLRRKHMLAAGFRLFAKFGFDTGKCEGI